MGGIGKSALSVTLMHHLAEHFQVVIFRSLRDAPSCETLLDECLRVFSPQLLSAVPVSLDRRISLLLEQMRGVRAGGPGQSGNAAGRRRGHWTVPPNLKGYGQLLRRVAETAQQGCLLLASREKPAELRAPEGKHAPARSLRLSGLETLACEQLLAEKETIGTPQEQTRLMKLYAGNPLALKIVAETISDLFGGEIGGGTVIFGSISDLLSEQWSRLSVLEQTVLRWLAIAREPVTIEECGLFLWYRLESGWDTLGECRDRYAGDPLGGS
jgi:hypothetical protein